MSSVPSSLPASNGMTIPSVPNLKDYKPKKITTPQIVALVFGSLAIGAGIFGILAARNIIPLKVGHTLFLGFGAGVLALGTLGVASSTLLKSRLKQVKVVSFNVGSFLDYQELDARKHMKEDIAPGQDVVAKRAEITRIIREKNINPHNPQFKVNRRTAAEFQLGRILSDFKPDILCLQEYEDFSKDPTNPFIKQVLVEAGYVIVGNNDAAVAYKASEFQAIFARRTYDRGNPQSPNKHGIFVDLKHKGTGLVVRAWSEHIEGFDVTTLQKDGTSPMRIGGDHALDESLKIVVKNIEQFAGGAQGSPSWPYMTVGGLDLNMGNEVTNSRISTVESNFFKTDGTNKQPTIIDGNDFVRRKYDFTVAKMDIRLEARLQNISITDERYAWGLEKHITKVSDHLPVMSVIKTVRKSWFSIPFIS